MELDIKARNAILNLKESLGILRRVREKSLITGFPMDKFLGIDQVERSILFKVEFIRDNQLLCEQDFCWLINQFDSMLDGVIKDRA